MNTSGLREDKKVGKIFIETIRKVQVKDLYESHVLVETFVRHWKLIKKKLKFLFQAECNAVSTLTKNLRST